MEHFLIRISTVEYVVVQDSDILNANCAEISNRDLVQLNARLGASAAPSSLILSGLNSVERKTLEYGGDFDKVEYLPEFDRIEREEGTNRLIENTIDLAANVTELAETHNDLVHGRGKILT